MTISKHFSDFDFLASSTWNAEFSNHNATRFVVKSGTEKLVITGTFTYFEDEYGAAFDTATFDAFKFYDNGILQHRITDINQTIETLFLNAITPTDVIKNMFSGDDTLIGSGNGDTLYGYGGNDILTGNKGNDTLFGGGRNDTLSGGRGHDILNGGYGNDTLTGNNGQDIFVFVRGEDVITDFTDGVDRLDLLMYESVDAILESALQNGADTVLYLDGGDTLTLQNFNLTDLDSSDFIL